MITFKEKPSEPKKTITFQSLNITDTFTCYNYDEDEIFIKIASTETTNAVSLITGYHYFFVKETVRPVDLVIEYSFRT
jgi:hypothetical protein